MVFVVVETVVATLELDEEQITVDVGPSDAQSCGKDASPGGKREPRTGKAFAANVNGLLESVNMVEISVPKPSKQLVETKLQYNTK